MEICERVDDCPTRFLSNKASTNANGNFRINSKRKLFKEIFLLIFVSLSLNLLKKFISCLSSSKRCCPTNDPYLAIWLVNSLGNALLAEPEQAFWSELICEIESTIVIRNVSYDYESTNVFQHLWLSVLNYL